ncbi:hypothetical protein HW571_21840 [Agrobacterium genomosp. 3]|uniref:type IV toxin-antitoxin system AbiEi family antitoxin n=1 Tax=Agrobacterium tomkonis TaxID=1183410 RepID=UPI001CD85DBC|nr:hypothetical protein [Agrobacterium tomkonis]MCA1878693.1 hypothetical protein [Agrobacterium tumefaciens]MCA1893918.1 hypothetical protein [Agrobacterium tomkonis]
MLKSDESMKQLEARAIEAVRDVLHRVPIQLWSIDRPDLGDNDAIDFLADLSIDGKQHLLACQVKSQGQPRHVRAAIFELISATRRLQLPATPVFIAPYLSPEVQALCIQHDVGFVDLVGNARLVFEKVYIERQVGTKPAAVQRGLKSIFKPKSAQVLRVLLRDPDRPWRVADLAGSADVSLGHVSNVRGELVDREWAEVTDDGLRLSRPDALLDAWRDVYEPPAGERISFYTTLHGQAFDASARAALNADQNRAHAVLASFSAAHWLAPYGRVSTHYFYADTAGLAALSNSLKLSPAASGANVVVVVLKERGLLYDTAEPASGVVCTSPVQTYLDLSAAGERGAEAAEHLRKELLSWHK